MKRTLISLLLFNIAIILWCQDHPDLGLNGLVTWIDSTHIRVEYDWSFDSQLLDWKMTTGSTLIRENGFVTVADGSNTSVRAMIWKQGIKCSRIIAKDAAPLSSAGHLNFYSNLISFTGSWLPNPGLGAVLITYNNFWTHDGVKGSNMGAPLLAVGDARDYEYNVSAVGMSIKSSIDNVIYSDNIPCIPAPDRKIALGGWGGNTRWGKITIEGEITVPWQFKPVPSDVINVQSTGAVFAPVIEVVGNPTLEWTFDDSTKSSSAAPVKDYGSAGSRHNYLKVTPWDALIGINLGYDASDGGYGDFAMVANQNVLGFQNLILAKSSLQYLCASYNPITELDLREFTALKFVELFQCQSLATVRLGSHPVLERLCVEDCLLDSLDLSGCTGLEDLRAALNAYTSIKWGSIGQSLWHICIRDNPQITENLPALTQFPVLGQLFNWNTNQTGQFICHSSVIRMIDSYNNHYTSADISGCTNLNKLSLSGSQLSSLNLGTANYLTNLQLKNCGLTESQMDYVFHTLDVAGRSSGYLDLSGNASPSADGLVHLNNLIAKNWTVIMVPVTNISVTGEGGATTISTESGTLQLYADVLPIDASVKSVTWSVTNGTGQATIDAAGLLTAVADGTVTARARANDGSGVYGSLVITISTATGITSFRDKGDSLKTIVTNNEIRISLTSDLLFWRASLINFQGRLLSNKLVVSNIISFDISSLSSGLYFVVLSNGTQRKVVKVISP
jgi:Leucine-rich repeat (LRR) protein